MENAKLGLVIVLTFAAVAIFGSLILYVNGNSELKTNPNLVGNLIAVSSVNDSGPVNPVPRTVVANISYCRDSDGGLNYSIKGTVNSSDASELTDYCVSNNITQAAKMLGEYYCSGAYVSVLYYNCPSGTICKDGACVDEKSNYTYLSKTLLMRLNETTEFNNKKVTLVRLSTSSAIMQVDSTFSAIVPNSTKTVNEVRLTLVNVLTKRIYANNSVSSSTFVLQPYAATIKMEMPPFV